jgi:hypothetical protein
LGTWSTAVAVPAGHRSTAIRPLLRTSAAEQVRLRVVGE